MKVISISYMVFILLGLEIHRRVVLGYALLLRRCLFLAVVSSPFVILEFFVHQCMHVDL